MKARGQLGGVLAASAAAALVLAAAYAIGAGTTQDFSRPLGYLAAGIPAVALSGFFAARRPAWSVAAILLVTAFSGTIAASFGVGARPLAWLLLLGLLAATVAGYLNSGRTHAVTIWPGIAALIAYIGYSALQVPFAETIQIGVRAFVDGPAMLLPFLAVAYALWNPTTRWLVAKGFVVVALLAGLYALFRLFAGPSGSELAIARRSAGVAGDLSLFGSLPNRLQLGAWSAVAIPMLLSLALAMRGRWRWLAGAAVALMLVALLGSEVRTALVGAALGIGAVATMFQFARSLRGSAPVALLAIAGLVVVGMVGFSLTVGTDDESSDRFARILAPDEDRSFQQRLERWEDALAKVNEDPFGAGLGTTGTTQRLYSRELRLDNRYIDNSYLQLGVSQGYPGWILLGLATLLIGYLLARSSLLAEDRRLAAMGIGGAASLGAWLVCLGTGDMLTAWATLLCWILVGLGAGGFVSGNRAAETAERA